MQSTFITLTEVVGHATEVRRTSVVINTAHIIYAAPDMKRGVTTVFATSRAFEVEEDFVSVSALLLKA